MILWYIQKRSRRPETFSSFFFPPANKGTVRELKYYSNSAVQGLVACRCIMRCTCDIAQRAGPASNSALDFVSLLIELKGNYLFLLESVHTEQCTNHKCWAGYRQLPSGCVSTSISVRVWGVLLKLPTRSHCHSYCALIRHTNWIAVCWKQRRTGAPELRL